MPGPNIGASPAAVLKNRPPVRLGTLTATVHLHQLLLLTGSDDHPLVEHRAEESPALPTDERFCPSPEFSDQVGHVYRVTRDHAHSYRKSRAATGCALRRRSEVRSMGWAEETSAVTAVASAVAVMGAW